MTPAEIGSSLGDLIVFLHRGNGSKAEAIVQNVTTHLQEILVPGADGVETQVHRAQQTMFAMEEVRAMLDKRDYVAASAAARDAAAEWRQK